MIEVLDPLCNFAYICPWEVSIVQFENFKFFADSIAQSAMPDYFYVGVVHHDLDAKNIRINYTQAALTPAFAYFFL